MEEIFQRTTTLDSNGKLLDGDRNYRMHLFTDIPDCIYWSVIVYDNDTNLIIKNDQLWPSVHSNSRRLIVNHDRSVDVFFGPEILNDKPCNWIKTLPGKGWYLIFRMHISSGSGLNKTLIPGVVELIK